MVRAVYCTRHLKKRIFYKEEEAHVYMQSKHPERNYSVYSCPEVSSHFHILNKTKRNSYREFKLRRNQQQRREK